MYTIKDFKNNLNAIGMSNRQLSQNLGQNSDYISSFTKKDGNKLTINIIIITDLLIKLKELNIDIESFLKSKDYKNDYYFKNKEEYAGKIDNLFQISRSKLSVLLGHKETYVNNNINVNDFAARTFIIIIDLLSELAYRKINIQNFLNEKNYSILKIADISSDSNEKVNTEIKYNVFKKDDNYLFDKIIDNSLEKSGKEDTSHTFVETLCKGDKIKITTNEKQIVGIFQKIDVNNGTFQRLFIEAENNIEDENFKAKLTLLSSSLEYTQDIENSIDEKSKVILKKFPQLPSFKKKSQIKKKIDEFEKYIKKTNDFIRKSIDVENIYYFIKKSDIDCEEFTELYIELVKKKILLDHSSKINFENINSSCFVTIEQKSILSPFLVAGQKKIIDFEKLN